MNIRIVALALLLAAQAGLAQESPRPAKARAAQRAAMLATLERGGPIQGSRGQYYHLPGVLAVSRASSAETLEQALARVGAGGAEVLETKGRLVLFRSPRRNAALVERVAGSSVYPTALNSRTGNLGVLTGTLVVQPRSMGDAAAIANSHGLDTAKEYPRIRFVFYRAKSGTDIAAAAAALQADPRVETAYPEIVEYVRTPK